MTMAWPMVTGGASTLALINLRIALADVRSAPHVFLSISALAVAAISGMELTLLQANDLHRIDTVLRWASLPLAVMEASVAGFVWSFFGTWPDLVRGDRRGIAHSLPGRECPERSPSGAPRGSDAPGGNVGRGGLTRFQPSSTDRGRWSN